MKVKCKKIDSKGFNLNEVTTIFSNEFDYSYGGQGYGLELHKEYLVMGILSYKGSNCLYYLIDINGQPDLFPYLLFDVIDNAIPKNWFIKVDEKKENNKGFFLIFGFKELCNEDYFFDQLIDSNNIATNIYFQRKIEMEQELKELEE